MSKHEVVTYIAAQRSLVVAALDFGYIVAEGSWRSQFAYYSLPGGVRLELDGVGFEWPYVGVSLVQKYSDPQTVEHSSVELAKIAMVAALTRSYERVAAYCTTGQERMLWEHAHWRPVARLIRNAMSHDFHLNFGRPEQRTDKSVTLSSGQVFVIPASEHGRPITGANLPIGIALELLDTIALWIVTEL